VSYYLLPVLVTKAYVGPSKKERLNLHPVQIELMIVKVKIGYVIFSPAGQKYFRAKSAEVVSPVVKSGLS
jgi:hypothetical protein